MDDLMGAMVSKGAEETQATKEVTKLASLSQEWLNMEPQIQKLPEVEKAVTVPEDNPPGNSSGSDLEGEGKGSAGGEGMYLIAVSRDKGACLHLTKGCWRARGRRFASFEVSPGIPLTDSWTRFVGVAGRNPPPWSRRRNPPRPPRPRDLQAPRC